MKNEEKKSNVNLVLCVVTLALKTIEFKILVDHEDE